MKCYDEWREEIKNLSGASSEIEFGRISYQKKDLEKLELRGWFLTLDEASVQSY